MADCQIKPPAMGRCLETLILKVDIGAQGGYRGSRCLLLHQYGSYIEAVNDRYAVSVSEMIQG